MEFSQPTKVALPPAIPNTERLQVKDESPSIPIIQTSEFSDSENKSIDPILPTVRVPLNTVPRNSLPINPILTNPVSSRNPAILSEPAPIPPKMSVMSDSSNFRQKQAQISAKSQSAKLEPNIAFMTSSDAVEALRKKYGLVQSNSEIKPKKREDAKPKDIFDRSIKITSQMDEKQHNMRIETLLRKDS